MSTFDDRHVDRRVELVLRMHGDADDDGDPGEQEQLPPSREAQRAAMAQLDVVVEEADRAAADGQEENGQRRQREPGEREEGQQRAEEDQQAAHHRRALLDDVPGRAFLADLLAELVPAQELDELRADHDRDHHRDQARYEDSGHLRVEVRQIGGDAFERDGARGLDEDGVSGADERLGPWPARRRHPAPTSLQRKPARASPTAITSTPSSAASSAISR